jgi:hypothetical protein
VLVLDEPPELLPDPLPPLELDPLADPELPVLEVPPEALPELLPEEPEPLDMLASPQSSGDGDDVSHAGELTAIATKHRRSFGRTRAS